MTTTETEKTETDEPTTDDKVETGEHGDHAEADDAAATEAFNKQKTRDYKVLIEHELPEQLRGMSQFRVDSVLVTVGVFNAATSKDAVGLAHKHNGEGDYIAVAVSGWNEHTAKLKQVEPQLVIE